jgi:hypothetical protein
MMKTVAIGIDQHGTAFTSKAVRGPPAFLQHFFWFASTHFFAPKGNTLASKKKAVHREMKLPL